MTHITTAGPAVCAYEQLAPYYDQFTAGYSHERWIAAIEAHATELGLSGHRALDIGCGTGRSTAPLLARGYSALACDISPEMVRFAREKFREQADSFFVADMRDLPPLGEFDLVACLDDCINYLLTDAELEATFSSVARVLAPSGIFVFDVNSLHTYRTGFSSSMIRELDGVFFGWQGEATAAVGPCEAAAATVDVFAERDDGLWERHTSRHRQRHHSGDAIRAALAAAGLGCCRVLGQRPGVRLEPTACEEEHAKLVYFARHLVDKAIAGEC
jgi:SAM-dependent methyltransferase